MPENAVAVVDDPADVLAHNGVSANLTVAEEIDGAVEESLDEPRAVHLDNVVYASKNKHFGLQILKIVNKVARPTDVRRTQHADGDVSFVPLKMGDVFHVRIINNKPYDVAVSLNIDGLNVYSFHQNQDKRHLPLIIRANREGTLTGWRVSDVRNSENKAFKIVPQSEGAVAIKMVPGNVGSITAQFRAAWPKGAAPPADERTRSRNEKIAVGLGEVVRQKVRSVERNVGRTLLSSISVRYRP